MPSANQTTNSSVIQTSQIDFANWCASPGFAAPGFDSKIQIEIARQRNLGGIELFPDSEATALQASGLRNPLLLASYPGTDFAPFEIGFATQEKDRWELVKAETIRLIEHASQYGKSNVIAFTGYGEPGDYAKGLAISRLAELGIYAQDRGITLCLEHLNNHQFDGPAGAMMGHPGYMGHDIHFVADIVKGAQGHGAIDGAKLLFDFYHVAIMHPGQELSLFQEYRDIIGHLHFAQNPGRSSIANEGTLDFHEVARSVAESGLNVPLGLEYLYPRGRNTALGSLDDSINILTGKSELAPVESK